MIALMLRALRERRAIAIPIGAALLLNLLAYIIVVRPLELKSVGSAGRAASAANNRAVAERELTQARNLVSGKAQADDELSAFYQKVLPADLTAARRMTYASLPALARKTNVQYETRKTDVEDPEGDSHLGHMAIRMVLTGEYRDIRRFIYQLETAPEFVIIDDLSLVEGADGEPQTLTINLSTYYRLVGSGR